MTKLEKRVIPSWQRMPFAVLMASTEGSMTWTEAPSFTKSELAGNWDEAFGGVPPVETALVSGSITETPSGAVRAETVGAPSFESESLLHAARMPRGRAASGARAIVSSAVNFMPCVRGE